MIRLLLVLFVPTPSMYGHAFSESERKSPERRKRSMLEDDPCLDAEQVNSLQSVEFLPRYVELSRPWLRNDITPKIFTSSGIRYQWTWAKSLAVRGLQNDTTIDDVLRYLDGHNCSFLATGHVVWQSVQRAHPVRIEGEISCSIPHVYSICIQKYGTKACSLYPEGRDDHQLRIEIGDAKSNRSLHQVNAEPLVLLEWGSVLGLPALRWSYTVMTMAIYDNTAGQVYLVDMTGRGYADTCGKSLAATVDDKRWPEWADEDVAKAYQFYLLRTMDFAASNHELQNFINEVIEGKHSKKAAQTFYCESILHGLVSYADENLTTTCHLMYPDHFARKQIAKANEILQKEMAEYWKQFMGELVDEMEAVYLTERQFVDVRNRIKCRVSEESGDRLLKYLESVNELPSHNGQQHHDNVSSIGAATNLLSTSSAEQHTSRTTDFVAAERNTNRSTAENVDKFVAPMQLSPRSQSSDIILRLSVFGLLWSFC